MITTDQKLKRGVGESKELSYLIFLFPHQSGFCADQEGLPGSHGFLSFREKKANDNTGTLEFLQALGAAE